MEILMDESNEFQCSKHENGICSVAASLHDKIYVTNCGVTSLQYIRPAETSDRS
jgi:hypothetical protein